VFDSRGQALSAGHAPFHSDQIEVLPEKETAVLYGNSPKGQNLALLNDEKGQLKETWKQTQARFADYTSTMLLIGDRIIIGLEESSRASALTAFDLGGRATWKIPLLTEESAYLFAPSVTNDKLWVSVGTDDSVLTLFEVTLR
jgi:hypothetical protein